MKLLTIEQGGWKVTPPFPIVFFSYTIGDISNWLMAMYFRDENYYFCSIMKIIMDILKLDQGGWGVGSPPKK